MRTELEQIKKIESYLNGELSEKEKAAFEERLTHEPGLMEEVELQRDLLKGIQRAALNQKVQGAGRRFHRLRNFRNWGGGGLLVLVAIGVLFLIARKTGGPSALSGLNNIPEKNQPVPDRNIKPQVFSIDLSHDTVVETRGGIVLSIPEGGFLDEAGRPVTGRIELVMREALDAASILKAGLSTRSGDRLLETGGMFYINATKDGKTLKIDPAKSIYAQIPTDTIKPGMMLFSGNRLPDGTLDWVNPRPLEHFLNPVDMHLLNFYPPHYLDSVTKWGYNAQDRRFTDSFYFSFAAMFRGGEAPLLKTDTSYGWPADCGIDPARVATIWSDPFQKTLIATREFEQRMPWIHRAGGRLLDLYINHLDKDLSVIDSMAAKQVSGELKAQFLAFAARRDGKVKNGVRQLDNLSRYYATKAKIFSDAIAKTQNEFWDRQAELDRKYSDRETDSLKRTGQQFIEEFKLNLKEACRQSGYKETISPPGEYIYQAEITASGWYNLDKYVMESVENRTTLNFKNPETGRTAVIKYLPVSFQLDQPDQYDRLYVYLLPDKLSSYMRIADSNGIFSEKLNELMQYDLVCLAYKGEQAFFYTRDKIRPEHYTHIRLQATSAAELDKELNKWGTKALAEAARQENIFSQFERMDRGRRQRNEDLRKLRIKMIEGFFKCALPQAEGDYMIPGQ